MQRWDADEELARTLARVHAGGSSPTPADCEWARHTLGLDGAHEEAWTLAG